MRIGVFGGTFDPVHLGHLIMAEQCREQARLDQVWFVPAARPPHKAEANITSFDRRADMIALAIAGTPAFQVKDLEKDRPGPSFTVDTLEAQAGIPTTITPGSWDQFALDLPWRAGRIRVAGLLIVGRAPVGEEQLRRCAAGQMRYAGGDRSPLIDLQPRSARRAASGRLRYFVHA